MRFYGIDPFRLAEIADQPELWGILVKAVEPLRAEEMLNGINVASMPHAKKQPARQFRKALERELKVYEPKKVSPMSTSGGAQASGVREHDPVKAAEWFRAVGIGVVDPK